jgi:hypothetical protein
MTDAQVFGDPDGMRALATQLSGRADIIGSTPGGFSSALDGATFVGGAATRLRGEAMTARGGISAAVAELQGLASALLGDADTVEQMNADAQAKAEAAEQAQGQQPGGDPGGSTAAPPDASATPDDTAVATAGAAPSDAGASPA